MRVCFYTETALPFVGGQELAIDALARQFISRGHQAVVLTLRPRTNQSADDRSLPYPVVRHKRYFSTRHLLDVYRTSLSAVYRNHPFDILHCHNVYPAGYIAARWAASRRVPLVLTSHACDIAPDSHLLKKPGVRERVSHVLQNASAVVAISEFVAQQFRELGANEQQIVRIPNGVNLGSFRTPADRPANLPAAVRPGNYFLFLGRLIQRKGADSLVSALRHSAAQHNAHIVIAGEGEQLEQLRSRAAQVGVSHRVHFLGLVAGQTKNYLLQNAICTVMPSRISEGFSLVVLESYAAGRPVIGTAIPGLSDAIRHNETGWLVPADSPAALAQALVAAAKDSHSIENMGAIARRTARQFDWKAIAAQHLALYERLLWGSPNRMAA